MKKHILFQNGDADAPCTIKDGHGQVVLNMCKICMKGEAELSGPCKSRTRHISSKLKNGSQKLLNV